jgi:hypothetical protein
MCSRCQHRSWPATSDTALREELKGLGGFRNVLVHGYLRIDRERVAEHLGTAPIRFSGFSTTSWARTTGATSREISKAPSRTAAA